MAPRSYYHDSLSILVVDDDPLMLRMMEATFRTDRHTVRVASDAESALDEFRSQPTELLLTDFNLPGQNGEQLAQEIKRLSPTTTVVIMTGISAISDYEGVDAVIRKPFTRAGIAATINRALKGESPDEGPSGGDTSVVLPRQ